MGYKNDILRGTTINIKPTISLNWSPIDIIDYNYALKSVDELKQKWDVDIQIMGNGFNLSFKPEEHITVQNKEGYYKTEKEESKPHIKDSKNFSLQ